ncbi:MAG TPA: PQQ-binding-like beta-propeller repeat protein [Gemmataceae bacterium]|nr:PQQ-binding-like beta-propeller repeat protein [Gemmataceae bacterium]
MKTWSLILAVVAWRFVSTVAWAADWPQWRGPQRNGISLETGLLKEWPKDGPKLLWQVKNIDFGYSTPSIVGERIYLLSNKGKDDEFAQALSVKDGSQIWATRLGKVGPNQGMPYPGARSTPTVDGEYLYVLGSDGDLACLERSKGKVRWQKNLRSDFGGKPGFWAYSESPLVDGDVLVCTPGGSKATIVALNKNTGDAIWQTPTPRGDAAAYSSAIVVDLDGTKQYVQFLQNGAVGVEAKTGKLLWQYGQTAKNSMANIPTPVAHDGLVYTASGQGGAGLVKLKANQSVVDAEPVYFQKKDLPNSIGGAVLIGDFLYGTNIKGLMCIEFATGKIKWQDKSVAPGSVCYADGNLYLHGEKGQVALIEATPEAYREKGRFAPPDQPKRAHTLAWAYPVIGNGRLYIRDLGVLWCYDIKDSK